MEICEEASFIIQTGREQGTKRIRGRFKTKREAEFVRIAKADMDMKFASFVEIYICGNIHERQRGRAETENIKK